MRSRLSKYFFIVFCLFLVAFSATAAEGRVDPVAKQYRLAKVRYQTMVDNRGQGKNRADWQALLQIFQKISYDHAKHDKAALSLFMAGKIAYSSYKRFKNPLDLGETIISYKDLATLHPSHRLVDDALYFLATIYLSDKGKPDLAARTLARIAAVYPKGDMAAQSIKLLKEIKGKGPPTLHSTAKKVPKARLAKVRPIRYWSTSGYTRVVIETSAPVRYQESLLKNGDGQARRLAVDLVGSSIPSGQRLEVGDGLLKQIKSEQRKTDTTRVVLDTMSVADYKIFSLDDPFRVVIDIFGRTDEIKVDSKKVFQGKAPSLAQQLGLGIRRIVVDPGHGGRDPGAIGLYGLKEKNITLKVAKAVADHLKKQSKFEVVLTRKADRFLPLEERTAIANTKGGDIFISIHVNASPDQKAKGFETYFLDLARTEDAMRVAALENATSTRELSDLQDILLGLMQNAKMEESSRLAKNVQASMARGVSKLFPGVESLGVKRAPFVVLMGARMPAVLIEIAFLSNPQEARRLKNKGYLNAIAVQIAEGISRYAQDLSLARL